MEFTQPIRFKEALAKIGEKSVIGSMLNSKEWAGVPTAIRDRAFFSATIESVRVLQGYRSWITDFLANNREVVVGPDGKERVALKVGGRAQFIEMSRQRAIDDGLGPLDPKDAGTIKDITSEQRLGLIFDVQTKSANEYGYWKQGQDPDILDWWPASRFIRVVDVETPRPLHRDNEGAVRLKSDLAFWLAMNDPAAGGFGVPWGPWGFNSGMDVEDVEREEAEALGLLEPSEKVEPVEQALDDTLQAGVRSLDPDMQEWLGSKFGDQVDLSDGIAKWKK